MAYPEQYRTELVNALSSIDVQAIDDVLAIMREALVHGRHVFICGSGPGGTAAAELLCEMLRSASVGRPRKFLVLAAGDQIPEARKTDNMLRDRVIVDQFRNIASPLDVVLGISAAGNPPALVRALTHAREIGCRTVCICGRSGAKLKAVSETVIQVPATELGSVEDAQMIVCRMIGHYFHQSNTD
jgi:D-sedoheptulose 7-phosphate isomerase